MTATVPTFPTVRLRRLRSHPYLRDLVREHHVSVTDLVQPLFIRHGAKVNNPIKSMSGVSQLSVDQLDAELDDIVGLGIRAVLLFGIPDTKDAVGSAACASDGVVQQAIGTIKHRHPELLVIADLCYCEYTDHGHCGVMNERTGRMDVDNDATLELLAEQAISLVRAGADIIAPSGHIDGMVQAVRKALDAADYSHIPIMSYSIKYASALYGPFREAAEGAPKFGDRRSYQIDPANGQEALREAEQDISEGADMLMVKPALAYLDVIARVKDRYPQLPMVAYIVSGEYAMIQAAAQNGWLDEQRVTLEILVGMKRAGADIIIHYDCKKVARWLQGE